MSNEVTLERAFWKHLDSDRVMMVSLAGADDHARPLTAVRDHGEGPIYFFTSKETSLARHLQDGAGDAMACFSAKGFDLFACVRGALHVDMDRDAIDRLWNPFIAAWYEGKDDPKLLLLRFDAQDAEVWENESSLLAGVKLLMGMDPKREYADHKAKVDLRQ